VNDPYAPFRPRRGRIVATAVAVAALVIFGIGALAVPKGSPQSGGWQPLDRLSLFAVGVLVAALMWRYATIRAIPSRDGLVVRNLFTTRRLLWTQVLQVQFGRGAPWVTLDLDDTDTVAVMAIQQSDGSRAQAEASRLAALVQALSDGADGPH
jgi:MFS family permease